MFYTLEKLQKENPGSHYISEGVVTHVNNCIKEIQADRSETLPTYGDRVKFTNKYGKYSLSNVNPADGFTKDGQINICEHGNSGFYYGHGISTSGGPWENVDKKNFKLIGKAEATFWTWGNNGPCGGGGVYFKTGVNLWLCDINEQRFSTEFYDVFYMSKHEPDDYGYTYSGFKAGRAFKTEADFLAWVKTFRGIIESRGKNSFTVWCYKDKLHHMTPMDQFLTLEGIDDTQIWNGSFRQVKRFYDDENHTVTTYLCREMPTLDWKTTKEYMAARKED